MIFNLTKLVGAFTIDVHPSQDSRGWFARTFCKNEFKKIGHTGEWLQLNHSFTRELGTIRGMHFQLAPHREIKLVRCIAGSVFDVIIDLRKESPTFLKWFGLELSAMNRKMIYIPEGFAHGFQTLTDNAELIYHHSQFYEPGCEGGIRYNDPAIAIEWPSKLTNISERDEQHPLLTNQFKGI